MALAFLVTASIYSSAGFGGGSTYLALLSIFPDAVFIRSVAYICNALVTGRSTYSFAKADWIKWNDIWPYLGGSVPLAIVGGTIHLDTRWYLFVLGLTLCFSALWMVIGLSFTPKWNLFTRTPFKIVSGATIGFLSGLVGIGGGVFLAPLLYLTKDQTHKSIAGITSAFILVNSIFGACAYWLSNGFVLHFNVSWKLLLAVVLGGYLGTYFTVKNKWKNYLRLMTAILIGVVGIRLILNGI